jgi:hypothetical protein
MPIKSFAQREDHREGHRDAKLPPRFTQPGEQGAQSGEGTDDEADAHRIVASPPPE